MVVKWEVNGLSTISGENSGKDKKKQRNLMKYEVANLRDVYDGNRTIREDNRKDDKMVRKLIEKAEQTIGTRDE